mmetsp:Transcript_16800/g.63966  ORF Transcript_16800/g.63966 Transcript_16800/m.63966 type:complete len:361 (-) Transcript_16800:77-1159(-)
MQTLLLSALLAALLQWPSQAFRAPLPVARRSSRLFMSISGDPLNVKGLQELQQSFNFSVEALPPPMPYQERKALWTDISKMESRLSRAVNAEKFELASQLREELDEMRSKDRYKVLEDFFEKALGVQEMEQAKVIQKLMIEVGAPPELPVSRRPWGGGSRRLTRESRDADDASPMTGTGPGYLENPQRRERKPIRSGNRGRSSLPEELRAGIEAKDTSRAMTDDVLVEVRSFYSPEQSKPAQNEFMFLYRVRITNKGDRTVRLLQRKWEIESASGGKEIAQGPGVIGTQPFLEPGQSFEYTSAVPIRGRVARRSGAAVVGRMSGVYVMRVEEDESGKGSSDPFEVRIAPFYLLLKDNEEN